MGKSAVISRSLVINAVPERIWSAVTDSDRFNRKSGLPSLTTMMERDSDDLNVPAARIKVLGIPIATQSDPVIEWEHPRWFRRERRFSGGPFHHLVSSQELNPSKDGTEVRYTLEVHPRGIFRYALPLLKFIIGKKIEGYLRLLSEEVPIDEPLDFQLGDKLSIMDRRYLDRRLKNLARFHFEPELVKGVSEWLEHAPDADLHRIRPLAVAKRLEMDETEILGFFLAGSTEALFDLHWDVICPNCRGVPDSRRDLKNIAEGYHCATCRLDLRADFDEALEATFSPHPALRKVDTKEYCYGSPAQTPHVLVQLRLKPGERRTIDNQPKGWVGYWVMPQKLRGGFELESGTSRIIKIDERDVYFVDKRQDVTGLTIENSASVPVLFQLQSTVYSTNVLTAVRLTSLQDFRDLFAAQLLSPDVKLAVKHLTFVFTDLEGSTAMYTDLGDSPAFDKVNRHFQVMREAVKGHQGGIVKTIGDAIMAVFVDPVKALKAAFEMQAGVRELKLVLKIGMHAGSCIAITQNEILDYFGTTVNTAARIESQSHGDIVMSEALYNLPGVSQVVAGMGVDIENDTAELKGLRPDVKLVRLVR